MRQNAAVPLAAGLALVGASALATQRWWLLPVLLVPLAVLGWALRSGVDADPGGLTVHGLLGSRRLGWEEVDGFDAADRAVRVRLIDGRSMVLPAVGCADVPRLLATSGHDLHADGDEEH